MYFVVSANKLSTYVINVKARGRGIACCTELQIALYTHTYICPLTQHVISMCLVCVHVHIVHVHTTHVLKYKFVFLLCKFNLILCVFPHFPLPPPHTLWCAADHWGGHWSGWSPWRHWRWTGCLGNQSPPRNKLRDIFNNFCHRACLAPQLEMGGWSREHTRPADVLVPNWVLGKSAAFDLSVTSTLNAHVFQEASVTAGSAAMALSRLATRLSTRQGLPKSLVCNELFGRLSLALCESKLSSHPIPLPINYAC